MRIAVECVDFNYTPYIEFLKSKQIFTALGICRLEGGPCFLIEGMPEEFGGFLMERFIPVQTKINIVFPDDIQSIDL